MIRPTTLFCTLMAVTLMGCEPKAAPSEPAPSAGEEAKAEATTQAKPSAEAKLTEFEVADFGFVFDCPADAPKRLCEQAATPRFGGYTLPIEVRFLGAMPALTATAAADSYEKVMSSSEDTMKRDGDVVTLSNKGTITTAHPIEVGDRFFMCRIIRTGLPSPESDELEIAGKALCASARPAKGHEARINCEVARATCEKRCASGDAWACLDLGVTIKLDEEDKANVAMAIGPLKSACDAGVKQGCEELAHGYKWGSFGAKDPKAARALQEMLCSEGGMNNCNAMGWILDAEGDLDKSIATFDKACKADDAKSCADLSNRLMKKKDEAAAATAKARACKLGWSSACP